MQYRKVILYLAQGYGYTNTFNGITLKTYIIKSDGSELVLTNLYDLAGNSNITPTPTKLFQSTLFNNKIEFWVPDIDYILNSQDVKIQELKNIILGSDNVEKIYFEYSALYDENIDNIIVNTNNYVTFNRSDLNSTYEDLNIQNVDVFADIQQDDTKSFMFSELKHIQYDVETFLNKFKEDEETFTVQHTFQVNQYDSGSQLIGSIVELKESPLDMFAPIRYRPVINNNSDYFETLCKIIVINNQTGLRFSKESSIIVSETNNYKTNETGFLLNLEEDVVFNRIEQKIENTIIEQSTPNIIEIRKKIYVNIETEADVLTLLNATFTVQINPNIDITNEDIIYIKIGNELYKNDDGLLTTFTIPQKTYNTNSSEYMLLNSNQAVITTGKINKK